ncbi:MAG: hemerythrin domain-containing protein [Nitrososphaerales archaeon]
MARPLGLREMVETLLSEHKGARSLLLELEELLLRDEAQKVAEGLIRLDRYLLQHIVDEEASILKRLINVYGSEKCEEEIRILQQHRIIYNILQECNKPHELTALKQKFAELKVILERHFKDGEEKVFPKVLKTLT